MASNSCVQINLVLGHKAIKRSKATASGFTHDWEVFVRGPPQTNIKDFVNKVVFYLHKDFKIPKRVVTETNSEGAYVVKESGYGCFKMPIEVYFKNAVEPHKVSFEYDLFLQSEGPPISQVCYQNITFKNPPEDFRLKLLKGGAVSLRVSPKSDSDTNTMNTTQRGELTTMTDSSQKRKNAEVERREKLPDTMVSTILSSPVAGSSSQSVDISSPCLVPLVQTGMKKTDMDMMSRPARPSTRSSSGVRCPNERYNSNSIEPHKSNTTKSQRAATSGPNPSTSVMKKSQSLTLQAPRTLLSLHKQHPKDYSKKKNKVEDPMPLPSHSSECSWSLSQQSSRSQDTSHSPSQVLSGSMLLQEFVSSGSTSGDIGSHSNLPGTSPSHGAGISSSVSCLSKLGEVFPSQLGQAGRMINANLGGNNCEDKSRR